MPELLWRIEEKSSLIPRLLKKPEPVVAPELLDQKPFIARETDPSGAGTVGMIGDTSALLRVRPAEISTFPLGPFGGIMMPKRCHLPTAQPAPPLAGGEMKARHILGLILACVFTLAIGAPAGLSAQAATGSVECSMTYSLSGWSAFYKTASGSGTITCTNGQKARVRLQAKGGGITVGKTEILRGTGEFTGVSNIRDTFGSYAEAEAHAGAGKSAEAKVLTKGSVSLALKGKGRGFDLGFAFGKLVIQRAK